MSKKRPTRRAHRKEGSAAPDTTAPIDAPAKRFALRFAGAAAVLFGLYAFPYAQYGISEAWFSQYLSAYARMVAWVLSIFEPGISVQGATLVGRTTLQIAKSCDAMEAKLLFTSAVLAFPGRPLRKALAILFGLLCLTAFNVLRIVTLYFILVKRQQSFDFFHLEVLPLFMILASVLLFIVSIKMVRGSSETAEPTGTHAAL